MKRGPAAGQTPSPPGRRPTRRHGLRRTPLFLLLFFLLLLMIGIAVGEPARVLEQARTVCLECIGVG
ncbi:MAG: CD1871A family CXXC motif-containing protein [Desulfobulbus sp.]|nr:CD1871A family CXXC motif-containing protein [Desulfobulbus sp.]